MERDVTNLPAMPPVAFTPARPGTLQRQCACGQQARPEEMCPGCRARQASLQRNPDGTAHASGVPPIVADVLRSPGEPLDPTARALMESRLGHRFAQVRVHRDNAAAESARAVGATAYTVDHHVVFGAGRYAPASPEGRRLLAHELTHVVQRGPAPASPSASRIEPAGGAHEREAEAVGRAVAAGRSPEPPVATAAGPGLQRQPAADFQLNISIDNSGRADVTVSGPNLPVVSSPTIGIRRTPEGQYLLVTGGGSTVVAPGEIPAKLRALLGAASRRGASPVREVYRTPTCAGLMTPRGDRYMRFDEYRVSQMLSPDLLPMSPPIYGALVRRCPPLNLPIPDQPPLPLQDAPEHVMPEGTAMA